MKKILRRCGLVVVLLIAAMSLMSNSSFAQGNKRVIQLSGIVVGEDSVSGVPGVHVYVPKAGRGTTTNSVGYFSLPVLVGDEIVISAVGFERRYFKIPDSEKDNLTIVIELISDTTFLETVEITPFPTEEVFKEAVIALNLPIEEDVNNQNLNPDLLALMLRTTPLDGYQNQSYYLNNWARYQNDRFGPRPNPLLNPFNWAKFFKSLKKKKK